MENYKTEFIKFVLEHKVLSFGEFTLKSGRKSPYFFNSGLLNTGSALAKLGFFYASALVASNVQYDLLFGPAYKGIPLVTSTAIALATHFDKDTPYAFNRKEVKDHGEGGNIIGAPLDGRIVIIDDVITAGTAIRESMQLFNQSTAKPAAIVIAMDRQEKGQGSSSAIEEIEQNFMIPVISIIKLQDLLEFLQEDPANKGIVDNILTYTKQYAI